MHEINQPQQEITAHLADLNETMQREKIPLSPEMKAYLKQSVEAVQTKLMNREPIYPKDMEFIEKIKLWMKFPEIASEEKFDLSLQTAKELDPQLQVPEDLRDRILAELSKLSFQRFLDICSEMQRPTLIIVPSNSFEEKVAQMSESEHFRPKWDPEVKWKPDVEGEVYKNVKTVNKVRVCIVDGEFTPKPISGAPIGLETRRNFEAKRTSDKNMDFIGPHRAAALFYQKLIEEEKNPYLNKDMKNNNISVTVLNPRTLPASTEIAYAIFIAHTLQIYFLSRGPEIETGRININGRASYQVMEF